MKKLMMVAGMVGVCSLAIPAVYAGDNIAEADRAFDVDKAPMAERGKNLPLDPGHPGYGSKFTDAEGAFTLVLLPAWSLRPDSGNPGVVRLQGVAKNSPFSCLVGRAEPKFNEPTLAQLQHTPENTARARLEPMAVAIMDTQTFEERTVIAIGGKEYPKKDPVRAFGWSVNAGNGTHKTLVLVPTPGYTIMTHCVSESANLNRNVVLSLFRVAEGALVPRKQATVSNRNGSGGNKAEIEQQFQAGVAAYQKRDYAQAMKLWRPLAEQGEMVSQNNIGLLYELGLGVPKNLPEAAKWYRKSAEQGYAGAQYGLGRLYENAQGVGQSYPEAANWYRKAAEQGNVLAQASLGKLYEYGRGVSQSYTEALSWYRKSAESGGAAGKTGLGAAYFQGHGVEQDPVQAYKWLKLGVDGGDPDARALLVLVLSSMTEEQIAQGGKLVEEWKAAHKR
ncbi:sel1 repeat family protein [Mariprofundus erugo]|uniref:tetratricopeptide repeat protein n=1 Tax=Mariprofundus erugo TaxID=2528639 RepID=UPI0010FD4B89|nr:tetratricopeptide repeat protein [Mariprofundus erugo]TLS78241.1 sel1 repeat family protein [Mariprofundus erugo]